MILYCVPGVELTNDNNWPDAPPKVSEPLVAIVCVELAAKVRVSALVTVLYKL